MADLHIRAQIPVRRFDINLSISSGERVAVVGPNGAGKSTLLHLIAGSLKPTTGSVEIAGEIVAGERYVPPHRRRVAFLEQRSLLFPHLSVIENVAFGPEARGVPRAEARARATQELDAVGALEFANRRAHQLSGGQAQRVALARALAIDPHIVLLDEPFAALDVTLAPELRRLLRARLQGITSLLVTHELLDAATLADRVIAIEDGSIAADVAVDELAGAPSTRFLADFVGLNLLHGSAIGPDRIKIGAQQLVGTPNEDLPEGRSTRAIIAPDAVSLHRMAHEGSPRNALRAVVREIEPQGRLVSVGLDLEGQPLRAHLTAGAVAELGLAPGDDVIAVMKAMQVTLHASPSSV